MSEPLTSRITLRREIARDLGMPFFRRFPSGITVQDSATSGLSSLSDSMGVRDSRFAQQPEFWKNSWLYDPTQGEQRLVTDFVRALKKLLVEFPFTAAPSTATTIEIFHIHSPEEVHLAVNDAILEAFPAFFDVTTYESMVLEEDKLEYELTTNNLDGRGVLTNPYRIKAVWLERTGSGGTHQATAGSTASITDSLADLSGVDTAWSLAIYGGAGAGQYSVIASVSTAAGSITPATLFTVSPDTSSKFRIWERKSELYAWDPITALEFDAKDYPNKMRLLERMNARAGLRFRIQYVAQPQALSVDTAETMVPKKYIKHKAMAKLLGQRARSKPGEAEKYTSLAQLEDQSAETYKNNNAFDLPDQQLWTEEHYTMRGRNDWFERDNPLDWD